MGNTSSHAGTPAGGSGSNSPSGPQSASTQNLAPPSSTSGSSQPIRTSTPLGGTGGTASTFHSGLTPPARTPSPPPPSTPPLLPFAGHLSPQNPHALGLSQTHDYSKTVVTGLILEARLAPFYRGLEDWEEEFGEEDVARILAEVREKDLEEGVENSYTKRIKEEKEGTTAVATQPQGKNSVSKRISSKKVVAGPSTAVLEARRKEEEDERDKRERKAYLNAIECPICFLNYPPNINTSRCCQQPICTECFVQIKRSEATITHLESEPACCPFCVETDFGVIYERPTALTSPSLESALAVSPDAGTSGFSQALSAHSEDVELSVGPGMPPKVQEKMRRKSVNSKAAEVVLIDTIRPDWENKLNSVKAAAARRASRRIVMRQVGDRLIPIGYTSSRAPATADFSMSVPQNSDENGSRRSRASSSARQTRERDLEQLMIMEAMRLSLLDHDDHLRKLASGERRGSGGGSGANTPGSTGEGSSRFGFSGGSSSTPPKQPKEGGSAASKLLSKLGNRSRSGSASSGKNVTFSPLSGQPARSSSSNLNSSSSASTSPAISPTNTTRMPLSNLGPTQASPVAPITTLTDHTAVAEQTPPTVAATAGLPRISIDMPALTPKPARPTSTILATGATAGAAAVAATVAGEGSGSGSTAPEESPAISITGVSYTQLDSDDE